MGDERQLFVAVVRCLEAGMTKDEILRVARGGSLA